MASNGSLRILDTSEVVFSLAPAAPCTEAMVVLVLSAPRNTDKRQLMRARTRGEAGTRTVFLLGATEAAQQARLEAEHREHGDIVQVRTHNPGAVIALHHHTRPGDRSRLVRHSLLQVLVWLPLGEPPLPPHSVRHQD